MRTSNKVLPGNGGCRILLLAKQAFTRSTQEPDHPFCLLRLAPTAGSLDQILKRTSFPSMSFIWLVTFKHKTAILSTKILHFPFRYFAQYSFSFPTLFFTQSSIRKCLTFHCGRVKVCLNMKKALTKTVGQP